MKKLIYLLLILLFGMSSCYEQDVAVKEMQHSNHHFILSSLDEIGTDTITYSQNLRGIMSFSKRLKKSMEKNELFKIEKYMKDTVIFIMPAIIDDQNQLIGWNVPRGEAIEMIETLIGTLKLDPQWSIYTFDAGKPNMEVYILEYTGANILGKYATVTIYFVLRNKQVFEVHLQ